MGYETRFLHALLLTVAVEGAVIVAMLRFFPGVNKWKIPLRRAVGAGVVPSVATLPYLWFVLPAFLTGYYLRTVIGEAGIILVETIILRLLLNLPLRDCAILSLLANIASILAGLAIFH